MGEPFHHHPTIVAFQCELNLTSRFHHLQAMYGKLIQNDRKHIWQPPQKQLTHIIACKTKTMRAQNLSDNVGVFKLKFGRESLCAEIKCLQVTITNLNVTHRCPALIFDLCSKCRAEKSVDGHSASEVTSENQSLKMATGTCRIRS